MNFDKIVERQLWLAHNIDGGHDEICIEIGRPRWIEPQVKAACPVHIRGVMSGPIDVFGSDLLSAVECALDFVKAELKSQPKGKVQWPGGEAYFD